MTTAPTADELADDIIKGLPALCRTSEVGAVLQEHDETVRARIRSGRLPSIRRPGRGGEPHRVPRAALRRYLVELLEAGAR